MIYVSNTLPNANDKTFCGMSYSQPCRTLEKAIARGDPTIRLMSSTTQPAVFNIWNTIDVNRDIEITVTPDTKVRPVIKLAQNLLGVHFIFRFTNTTHYRTAKLSLKFISFKDTTVVDFGYNGILRIEDCYFGNIPSRVISGAFSRLTLAAIRIENSNFENCESVVNVLQYSLESNFNKNLNFSFHITKSIVTSATTTTPTPPATPTSAPVSFINGVLISITNPIASFSLKVVDTTFSYLTQAIRISTAQEKHIDFVISDSKFLHNYLNMPSILSTGQTCPKCVITCGSGVMYNGKGKLYVYRTVFFNNTANKGGGACIAGPDATFKHVTFDSNKAIESGGACYVTSSTVLFDHGKFTLNSASLRNIALDDEKHNLDSTGYGGAIRSNGDVTIANSQFIHNHAYVFGGAVCHDGENLNLTGNMFVGPKEYEDTSLHGSILYTKTESHLQNNSFYSVSANSQGSVLFHSSNRIALYIKSTFLFVCKTGEQITRSYNHQDGKTEFSLLMFVCKPCLDGHYSLQQGTLLMSSIHNETDVNVQCQKCPQGGICENGIRSIANFWGWKTKDGNEVKFLSCPTSTYCCNQKHCTSYDSCAPNREGRLCGQCRKNYSESLFASVCIANEKCIGSLVWPFLVLVGFSYVFVLLYFKDIFSYIKLLLLKPVAFLQRIKSVNQTTDLDELDNFYVVLGGAASSTPEMIIHHEMPPDDVFATTNDESSMINPDDDDTGLFDESGEFVYHTLADNGGDEINFITNSITKRLINCDHFSVTSTIATNPTLPTTTTTTTTETTVSPRSSRRKIKWYSYLFGIFKIIVFFYQMQLLSKVPSVLESSYQFSGPQFLKEFVTGIFNMKMTGSYFTFHLCMFRDLEPILKRYLKMLFVLLLFVILLCFYLVYKLCLKLRKILSSGSCVQTRQNENDEKRKKLPLSIRVKCCILQLLLLSYSTISTATFELIHCVRINDVEDDTDYSYINANEECKGSWYIFAKLLAAFWSIPFFIAVFGANKLLRDQRIRIREFLLILHFPPLLLYFVARNVYRRYKRIDLCAAEIQTRDHLLQVLEMPFQKKSATHSVWYWEAMLILRRLILVCIYVFLPEPIPRLYVMCIPLTLFLVDHLRVQPYNNRLLNWLETASLLCLVFLVSINLFWAYSYETNVPISNTLSLISHVFLYVETIILLLPLIFIGFIIVVAIATRMVKKIRK